MLYIKENDGAVLSCHHVVEQCAALGCNVCFAKDLANGDSAKDAAISPVIIFGSEGPPQPAQQCRINVPLPLTHILPFYT